MSESATIREALLEDFQTKHKMNLNEVHRALQGISALSISSSQGIP